LSKKKIVETVVVSFQDYSEPDFHQPSNFHYVNALGDKVYIKVSNRKEAEEHIVSEYGYLKYSINSQKKESSDKLTVRGFTNSKSRSGAYMKQIKNSQGRF
jgi:hypothetical protein